MAASDSSVHVSVIVPAYREELRIGTCIDELTRWLAAQPWDYEVLVVDDGSDDATASVVAEYAERNPRVRLSGYSPNRGKGYAVRSGLAQATGDYVMFTDADLATPIEAIGQALELLGEGEADVVVATRAHAGSALIVRQRWYREGMGRIFNQIARLLGLTTILDTQCGFKAFRGGVVANLIAALHVDGFAFDVELLVEADRLGLRVVELPVRWSNHSESRVHIVRDSSRMLVDLLIIAARERRRPRRVRKEDQHVRR